MTASERSPEEWKLARKAHARRRKVINRSSFKALPKALAHSMNDAVLAEESDRMRILDDLWHHFNFDGHRPFEPKS
ncbi:MAG: hypothetical protein KGI73_03170 [Patescibacteria group bacterium]|nr:hypothetical protein [Patescibacteria group bacterium]